jgi:putative tryptophan/tyrosine transport system substrate-binding protein
VDRRAFIGALTGGLLAAPLAVQAQQSGKVWRIGLLVSGPPPGEHQCVLALRRGLTDLGYVEGRTHVFEIRWTEGRSEDTFPRFGAELVRLGVDLVVSVTSQGLREAKDALAGVPVVMAAGVYPVERGLAASLNRPGANITGMATFTGELFSKRIQILAEAVPGVSRAVVLRIPGDQSDLIVRDLEKGARKLGLKLRVIALKGEGAEDLPAAFQTASRGGAQAVMTTQGPFFYQHTARAAAEPHPSPRVKVVWSLPSGSMSAGAGYRRRRVRSAAPTSARCPCASRTCDTSAGSPTPSRAISPGAATPRRSSPSRAPTARWCSST